MITRRGQSLDNRRRSQHRWTRGHDAYAIGVTNRLSRLPSLITRSVSHVGAIVPSLFPSDNTAHLVVSDSRKQVGRTSQLRPPAKCNSETPITSSGVPAAYARPRAGRRSCGIAYTSMDWLVWCLGVWPYARQTASPIPLTSGCLRVE